MDDIQVVIFDINGQQFGAEAWQVFQIIKYQEATKVPRMPKFIEGIMNFRDSALPVINLAKRFDMGDVTINKKTKILVARIDDNYAGFIVNDVSEILRFAGNEIDSSPIMMQTGAAEYLKKVAIRGEKLISIIDLEKVLNDNEVKRLSSTLKRTEAMKTEEK